MASLWQRPWHPLITPAAPRGGASTTVPAPDNGTASEGSLDALLRFKGGASTAAAPLETAFASALALSMRWSRTACLLFLAVVYAAAIVVYAATAAPTPGNWIYLVVSVASVALIPGVRAARALAAELAATAGAALILFAFNFDGGAVLLCSTGAYTALMLYAAMPLVAGITFAPRWRVYAAMCTAHAVRGAVELSPLGPPAALLVFAASVFGAILLYLHERRARMHFVRCASVCCPACALCWNHCPAAAAGQISLRALEQSAERFELSFRHICAAVAPAAAVSAALHAARAQATRSVTRCTASPLASTRACPASSPPLSCERSSSRLRTASA